MAIIYKAMVQAEVFFAVLCTTEAAQRLLVILLLTVFGLNVW